jgi:hypothetical protein
LLIGRVMSDEELYTQLIARLVDYFGDYSTVAAVLNVHERDLREWSEGKTAPPLEFVRGAIDLADELAVSEAQHGSTTARAAWNISYSRRPIDASEP